MTSALEFTYLYDGFSLRINESTMNRAVRVKTAVKDKIKRVFESKKTTMNSDNVVARVETVQVNKKESLIDLSQEKLSDLNNILNWLEGQKNVSYTVNRAVLFTQPLVKKINRVFAKWFDGMPRIEKKEETSTFDIPSVDMINHLGGEVVPGNWNSVLEKGEVENTPLSLEPVLTVEPVAEKTPEVTLVPQTENVPVSDVSQLEMVPPILETTTAISGVKPVNTGVELQKELPKINIEIPSVSENTDIYKFPSFDFDMESLTPTVVNDTKETEVNNTSFDFVPEPKNIDEMNKEEVVSEPTTIGDNGANLAFEMPTFDGVVSTPNMEEKVTTEPVVTPEKEVRKVNNSPMEDAIGELLNREFTSNPANNFVPEHIDNRPAEDKIDGLLGRSKIIKMPNIESKVQDTVTSVSEQKEVKPEITQGQIMARLRRVNNEMAEKDATIKSLTAKNDALREEVSANKDKVAEYEVRVSDLSAKNTDLANQNERLSSKLEEVESNSKSTISKLEAKVTELTQAKTDELESLRRQLEELKTKHASEISSMREKHSAEIKEVTESKDKQIQAIYSTISEALGEPNEEYTKGMAA